MSKRRKAREIALQMLYQQDLGGSSWEEICRRFDTAEYAGSTAGEENDEAAPRSAAERRQLAAARRYAETIAASVLENREEIDRMIRDQAENWRLERMAPVDRNILRLALAEFLYQPDVPQLVVVDEAIELAKRFGSEKSSSFVNGILDGLLKSQSFPGRLK